MPALLALLALGPADAQEIRRFDRIALGELLGEVREALGTEIPGLEADASGATFQLRGVTLTLTREPGPAFSALATTTILDRVTATVLLQSLRIDERFLVLLTLRPDALSLGDLHAGASGAAGSLRLPEAIFTVVPSLSPTQRARVPSRMLDPSARDLYRQVYGSDDFTLELAPGINLFSTWSLSSLPRQPLHILGLSARDEVVLEGTWGGGLRALAAGGDPGAGELYLRGTLPTPSGTSARLPGWLRRVRPTALQLELTVDGSAAMARLGSRFEADLDGRSRSFVGSTVLTLGEAPETVTLTAALEDDWARPFDVGWLTLEDVVLILTFDAAGDVAGQLHGFFQLGATRVSTRIESASSAGGGASFRFTGRANRVEPAALLDLLRRHSGNRSLQLDLPSSLDEFRDVRLSFAAGAGAALAFSGTALADLELDGRPRRFEVTTRLTLERGEPEVAFDGRLVGVWDRPFGVEWLRLDDVHLEFGAAAGADPVAGGTLRSGFDVGRSRIELQIEVRKERAGRTARFTGSAASLPLGEFTELARRQLGDAPIPGGDLDLEIRDLRMTLEVGSRRSFSMAARTSLRGQEADLLLFTAVKDGQRHIVTGLRLDDWSLGDAVPALGGTLVERVRLASVALLVTRASGRLEATDLSPEAYEFYRRVVGADDFTLSLEPGIGLVGRMPLGEESPLFRPLEALGATADQVSVAGTLPGSALGLGTGGALSLRAGLPPMAPSLPDGRRPPWFRSGQLALFIEAGPGGAGVGLDGTLDVTIDDTDMSFIVAGEFGGPPVAIGLSGKLAADRAWVSPFDIQWLVVREVGVGLFFNPASASLGLGFTGDVDIGSKNLEVDLGLALNVTTGVPTNFIFRGASSTAFALSDLVDLQQRMAAAAGRGGKIPTDAIPNVEIRPLDGDTPIEVKFALRASDEVAQGFALSGALYTALRQAAPLELVAEVDCRIGVQGISMFGRSPRQIGVGNVTLDRPLVDLDLAAVPPKASFVLTGDLVLPWFTRRVDVELGREANISQAVAKVGKAAAAFRRFSAAFREDPVKAVSTSLAGAQGLFAAADVTEPAWVDGMLVAIESVRELHQGADPRTLLGHALKGTQVTVPAGKGYPDGGRAPLGCPLRQTLAQGRCWDTVPSAGEELGYALRCVGSRLERGRCWLVPPSATRTRSKVRVGGRSVCPSATRESGGRCYVVPPGPPRRASPDTPRRICAGVEQDGKCWKLGRAPRAGSPTGGADPRCAAVTPIPHQGRCWRVPPTPEIQVSEIGGICKTAPVSCTVDGLLTETISPLIRGGVEKLLAPVESKRGGS